MANTTQIDWIDSPTTKDMGVSQLIEQQIRATKGADHSILQEFSSGIYLLTIPHHRHSSHTIKKIADKAQYSILSHRHNDEPIMRLSYNQLRNLCHAESVCLWAKRVGDQESETSRVHLVFFYHLATLEKEWGTTLQQANLNVKERLSNRLLIISDGTYLYPYDISRLAAQSMWHEIALGHALKTELCLLKKKIAFFPRLFAALKQAFKTLQWDVANGRMTYSGGGIAKSFDYPTLADDLFFANLTDHPESFLKCFTVSDLNCSSAFPTVSLRSLVHLKARPDSLSSLQNGFIYCAALENKGKQSPVETSNHGGPLVFSHWLRRSKRHLYRHNYLARVIFAANEAIPVVSLVGEQMASIAIFPELIKGVLEQLSLNFKSNVRIIAHNEDVLTIAGDDASWSDINEVNQKASTLFKMVSLDGADPLSLFEQIALPAHGVGTFKLSVVPNEYFELVDTAFRMKHTMPPGHDHYLIGLSYECLEEWGMAVAEFKKALRQDSQDSTILSALGCALMEIGRHESALPFLKRAYDARPDDADLANNLGRLHLQCGNTKDAIGAFERAVRLSPGSADYLVNLGSGYLDAARPLDALDIFNKAVRCDPAFATAHERLAQLHLQNGNEQLARQHALIAYQENPVDPNIANLLWRLTMGKKDQLKS